jgi:endonuclease/exonuclease/phosphatase family metal-dependent hydrolase
MPPRHPFALELLAAVAAVTGVGCTPLPPPAPARAAAGTAAVTVMSYNVNFGIPGDAETVEAIAGGGADVVFLQETTPEWEERLRERLAAAYPHMAFHHSAGAGGLAVLSRYPFRSGRILPSPKGWFPAWTVVVSTPIGPLQALNVHLRPPVSDSGSWVSGYFTTRPVRQAEIRTYLPALDPSLPTVVLGDFNEGRSGRAVSEVRRRGMTEALGSRPPTTWRWPTPVGTLRLHLDHILHDQRLRVLGASVLRKGRSDHLPVIATLARAASR